MSNLGKAIIEMTFTKRELMEIPDVSLPDSVIVTSGEHWSCDRNPAIDLLNEYSPCRGCGNNWEWIEGKTPKDWLARCLTCGKTYQAAGGDPNISTGEPSTPEAGKEPLINSK